MKLEILLLTASTNCKERWPRPNRNLQQCCLASKTFSGCSTYRFRERRLQYRTVLSVSRVKYDTVSHLIPPAIGSDFCAVDNIVEGDDDVEDMMTSL